MSVAVTFNVHLCLPRSFRAVLNRRDALLSQKRQLGLVYQ